MSKPKYQQITEKSSDNPKASPPESPADRLIRLISIFRRWFHIPDTGILLAVCGAYAAHHLEKDGTPVWLLLVGPPSGGKTAFLMSLDVLLGVWPVSTLTESSLLSGTPSKERNKSASGGLLKKVGLEGVLLIKDFTSILSISADARNSLLAALREIFDGKWVRHLGVDGGSTLQWDGKITVIGGCTTAIDTHHAVMSAMGERFLLYRMLPADEAALARRALDQDGSDAQMKDEIGNGVKDLLDGSSWHARRLCDADKARITAIATLAARCRSSVERDGRTRDIELIPEPEVPARLARQLAALFRGMLAIGAEESEAWRVLTKVALDCVPTVRRAVFEVLRTSDRTIETAEIAARIRYPNATTRRALEDLEAHRVLEKTSLGTGNSCLWNLSSWAREHCRAVFGSVPENSGKSATVTVPEN